MKSLPVRRLLPPIFIAGALLVSPLSAQDETKTLPAPAAAKPASNPAEDADMMKQMMELSKLNDNHKLLAAMNGSWTTDSKMWMAPGAPPMQSTGTATRKPIMDGRYFIEDFAGKVPMPGPDGKMKEMSFTGMSINAYDNVKKKFLATWMDSMSTGIYLAEGDYDPATKTFTYNGEAEEVPGMKTKVRQTVKVIDNDHHVFEYFESRGADYVKTMEIAYTRKK